MKSISRSTIPLFSVFLGCTFFFGIISCKRSTTLLNYVPASERIKDSLIQAWATCCPDSDLNDSNGLKFICPENPGNTNAVAFIRQQRDNNHLALAYYAVLTPKMIHLFDSLNMTRGSSAPNYYAFVFENDSTHYTIPISSSEIDSGKLSAPDSIALFQIYDPPACYYPHCAPKHILIVKKDTIKK